MLSSARVEVRAGKHATTTARLLRMDRYSVTHLIAEGGSITWRPSPGTGENRFLFVFVSRGNLSVSADEARIATSTEAILAVFPGAGPVTMSSAAPIEALAFTFDADDAAPLTLTPETIGVLRPTSSVFRASYSLLRALVEVDDLGQEEDTAALRSLLHGTARGMLRAAHVATTATTLREAAAEIIAEQHTNPALDVQRIAAQLNVSASTLYRASAQEPLSVAAQLRRRRAETASQQLKANPTVSLVALAEQCGFGSVSSLRRAMREREGVRNPA